MKLLDTNICVYAIRNRPAGIRERLDAEGLSAVALSIITAMELEVGAWRSGGTDYARRVRRFLAQIEVLALDDGSREIYGELRLSLEKRGSMIGPLDALIAAHTLALDATLVTNNQREFKRVKGLRLENWVD